MTRARTKLGKSAERLLADIAAHKARSEPGRNRSVIHGRGEDFEVLIATDLAVRRSDGVVEVTSAGLAHLARQSAARMHSPIDPFRAQHLDLAQRTLGITGGAVIIDEAESPLAWLARRKGRDGRFLIAPVQLQAGERLRTEFTRAQLMPRTTSSWSTAMADGHRGAGQPTTFTEAVIAARQRVRQALDTVGPEFSGLLLDVCCFLKGLADVERERGWPSRSAKVVLQLGLDRLARHYGLGAEARGRAHVPIRTWIAPETGFVLTE
jgi:hypothetical protein